MEGMRKSNVELIIDKYEKFGKVKTVSVEESTEIFDAIDGRIPTAGAGNRPAHSGAGRTRHN